MKGCDHSTGGAQIGAALKAAGYGGVFRYAAAGRGSVNITPAEVHDLQAHGIQIAIVNEFAADYLLGGYQAGHDGALGAQRICRACGLPDGVVFMAGDFDATRSSPAAANNINMLDIAAALRGAKAAIGSDNVGFYGGYFAIDWLVRYGPANLLFWQAESSYGAGRSVHPRACAVQVLTGPIDIGGVQVDRDDELANYWGQRGFMPSPPSKPEGDDMLAEATNKDGRREVFTVLKDGTAKHIWQEYADDGTVHWHGEQGVTAHKWENLGNVGGTPIGIAAGRNEAQGTIEVEVKLDDGSAVSCWQDVPGGGWHGARPGVAICKWETFGNPGA